MSVEGQPNTVLEVYTPFAWVQEVGGSTFTKSQADQLYFRKTVEDTDPYVANFTDVVNIGFLKTNVIRSQLGYISLGASTTDTQLTSDNSSLIATTAFVKIQSYGSKLLQNTWDLLQTFTSGIKTNAITSITGNISLGQATTTTQVVSNNSTLIATTAYVKNQAYITASALIGYATETYVTTQGYITASALVGYATETYVTTRGYITASALTGYAQLAVANVWDLLQQFTSGIKTNTITSITGNISLGQATTTTQANGDSSTLIATTAFVKNQAYITASALVGYATETYVTTRGYITASALTGYATESWVTSQGYLTSAVLTGYAQLAVANVWNLLQQFTSGIKTNTITSITGNISLGQSTTTTQANGDSSTLIATTAFVKNQAYITASALVGYATQNFVTTQGYITYSALTGYAQLAAENTWNLIQQFSSGIKTNSITSIAGNISLGQTATITQANGDFSTYIATTAFVKNQAYITLSALTGYATQAWVTSQNYLTTAVLDGYATQAWVTSQNYITSSALTGYAQLAAQNTWNLVQQFSSGVKTNSIVSITGEYISIALSTTTTQATSDNSTLLATTAFVKNQAYVTASYVAANFAALSSNNFFTTKQTFTGGIEVNTINPPSFGSLSISGSATTTTQPVGTNDTSLATTAFVLANAGGNPNTNQIVPTFTYQAGATRLGGFTRTVLTSFDASVTFGNSLVIVPINGLPNGFYSVTFTAGFNHTGSMTVIPKCKLYSSTNTNTNLNYPSGLRIDSSEWGGQLFQQNITRNIYAFPWGITFSGYIWIGGTTTSNQTVTGNIYVRYENDGGGTTTCDSATLIVVRIG